VNEQQRRRLPRAVVDHVHPVRLLKVIITHERDDTALPATSLGRMSAPRSTIRDGKIVLFRDYFNPLGFEELLRG